MAELYQLCKNPVIIQRNMLDMFLVEFLRKKIYGYLITLELLSNQGSEIDNHFSLLYPF